MVDAFSPADLGQDLGFFVEMIRRDDEGNRPSNRLLAGVTEYAFGTLVPAGDDPAQVLTYDSVIGGIDDCGQQINAGIKLLWGSDFDQHFNAADNLSFRIAQRPGERRKPAAGTVWTLGNCLFAIHG